MATQTARTITSGVRAYGTIPAITSRALLEVGGPFTGAAGAFSGSVNGSLIGGNAPNGYSGNLLDLGVNGTSKFGVGNTGRITASGYSIDANTINWAGSGGMVAAYSAGSIIIQTSNGGVANSTAAFGRTANGNAPTQAAFDLQGVAVNVGANEAPAMAVRASTTTIATLPTFRSSLFEVPTFTAATAQTITTAATLAIAGAPAVAGSAVITNSHALWIQAGAARFDGPISLSTAQGTAGQVLTSGGAGAAASWTSGGVTLPATFTGAAGASTALTINPSTATGLLLDVQVNGTSRFRVNNNGVATISGSTDTVTIDTTQSPVKFSVSGSNAFQFATSGGVASTYGYLSVGGIFDGSTTGFFSGSSGGTMVAANAASGFTGNLLDLQVNGVSQAKVSAAGLGTFNGGIAVPAGATFNNIAKAAAIASPTSDTVGTKAAIDALRVALANIGITL